jgi:hypothetical protein
MMIWKGYGGSSMISDTLNLLKAGIKQGGTKVD